MEIKYLIQKVLFFIEKTIVLVFLPFLLHLFSFPNFFGTYNWLFIQDYSFFILFIITLKNNETVNFAKNTSPFKKSCYFLILPETHKSKVKKIYFFIRTCRYFLKRNYITLLVQTQRTLVYGFRLSICEWLWFFQKEVIS